jgi:hypothetical protein
LRRVSVGEHHRRIAPLGIFDGREHRAQFTVAIQHEFDRGAVACGDLLFHVSDCKVRRPLDIAVVGAEFAENRRKQTGLTGAVGAGDAGLLAAENGEVDLLEKRLRTAPQGEIPSR